MINGKELAQKILDELKLEVQNLKQKGINPKIVIITLGDEQSWESYVNQKIKRAAELRIEVNHINLKEQNEETLLELVDKLNRDETVHGFIVQRPFAKEIDKEKVISAVSPQKDIDGFRHDSKFEVPVWLAVKEILNQVFLQTHEADFKEWLKSKNIVVLGKGETAGKPTIAGLGKLGNRPTVIDSQTKNREELLKQADIVISAVGKDRVVQAQDLKQGVILIGVGTHKEEDGKLHGDYNEEEIQNIASLYTPTPKGIGPLNLAYLFKNLIQAAKS